MNFQSKWRSIFLKSFFNAILNHWEALAYQLDPILPSSKVKKYLNISHHHYFFLLALTLFNQLYGIIGLHFEATGSILYTLDDLKKSKHIYTHQMGPKMIWNQGDFIVLFSDFYAMMGVFLALLLTKPIKPHFRFLLMSHSDELQQIQKKYMIQINGRALSEEETTEMLKTRQRIKSILKFLNPSFYLFLCAFFYGNVWLNVVYVVSLSSFAYWIIVFPLFLAYSIYAICGILIFTIFSVLYIQIQQKELIKKFTKLIAKMKDTPENSKPKNYQKYWTTFCQLNGQLVFLCRTVDEYSRFCVPFLNTIFPYYLTVQCYLLYIVTLVKDFPLEQSAIIYISIFECNLFLFVCTHECALIVKYNGIFERVNRQFVLVYTFDRKKGKFNTSVCQLIKAELFMASKRLHGYSFKILSNYRITSQMYYTIISEVSVFFMFLAKDAFKNKNITL